MTIVTPFLRSQSSAERLNAGCFCLSLDRDALFKALEREAGDPAFVKTYMPGREHLFANVSTFIPAAAYAQMEAVVSAIEATVHLPGYRAEVLARAPEIARTDHGPRGMFMGYDFHIEADGPKLIEVNTNAGGAFLNALLLQAQRVCCPEVEGNRETLLGDAFAPAVIAMFREEWRRQRGDAPLGRVAIVDDNPGGQYLYPEFLLAQRMLLKAGIDAVIVDGGSLRYEGRRLLADGKAVDFVYNRLVDFSFAESRHAALNAAYAEGAVVVSPNPHAHALFADKRNLTLFSDPAKLAEWGSPAPMLDALAGVPRTIEVTNENADELWKSRKQWFFKPVSGYGGKAVYRGDKLTRGVWADILGGGYVAQALAVPGSRIIRHEGVEAAYKMDTRLYTYTGRTLIAAARLYQGQTTNFRTAGGGFAPLYIV
ncbi:MAG: hypothetical protein P4M15_08345 [Alphaproteobacteria bacterium]|nr:hypothetical protein [Alphaproteobacteria bacterium]